MPAKTNNPNKPQSKPDDDFTMAKKTMATNNTVLNSLNKRNLNDEYLKTPCVCCL